MGLLVILSLIRAVINSYLSVAINPCLAVISFMMWGGLPVSPRERSD